MDKFQHNFTKEDMLWSIQDVSQQFRWDKTNKELKLQIWRMRSRLDMLSEILKREE
jgi:hypothetical protein